MSATIGFPFQGLVPSPLTPPLPEVFANQIRMNVTFTDFTLVFGATENGIIAAGPAVANVRDKVAVHLAPGMLKQLYLTVQWAVEAYETAVGPIPMPSNIQDLIEIQKRGLISNLRNIMTGETPPNMSP